MEEKNVGKFLNYMKKFLTMSFLSALATVAFSCFNVTKADGGDDENNYGDAPTGYVSELSGSDLSDGSGPLEQENSDDKTESKTSSSESDEKIEDSEEKKSESASEVGSENSSEANSDESIAASESEIASSEEIQKTPVSLLRTVIRCRNGDDWKSVFTRAGASTHDSSGNKKSDCTGYWVVRNYEGDIVYNERNGFIRGTVYYDDQVTFEYYEGSDDSYSSVGKINVDLSIISQDHLRTDKYSYSYTITGTEQKTGDIDPSELAKKANIKVSDGYNQTVSGTWHWENTEAPLTDYLSYPTLIFSPDDNLYSPATVTINVLNPGKSEVRSAASSNDVTQNVSNDGVTSTIKKSSGITWLREESDGSAAWYGFEDPNGVLPDGTRLSVKWKDLDKDEYWDIFNFFKYGGLLPEKVWQFDLQALDSNNELITDFNGNSLNVYVEVGEDWDLDEITALYSRLDEKTKETWDLTTKEMTIDGKKRTFAVFSPKHFSPHYFVDKTTPEDIYENTNKEVEAKLEAWKAEHPDASTEEIVAKRKELIAEELKEFTTEQKNAYNQEAGKAIYENLIESVTEDFDKWLADNPNATEAQKLQKKQEILMEKYDALSDEDKQLIEDYLNAEMKKSAAEAEEAAKAATTSTTSNASNSTTPTTSSTTSSSSPSSSTSSSSSASTKTGDDANGYVNVLSLLLAGSFTGISSCLKKKKD
jgi:hypothetical protein